MAEYVMGEDENQQDVARYLLDQAGDRAGDIQFLPRANVHGGGVFQMPDDLADSIGGDRITRVDTDPVGTQRAAAAGEDESEAGEPTGTTAMNDRLLSGEASASPSPATGDNPTFHGAEVGDDGKAVPDEERTVNKRRRAAAKNTNTE